MTLPRFLAVSELATLEVPLERWLAGLVEVGVDGVWLRERARGDKEILDIALRCRRALPAAVRLVVSARADLALLADADGVHLPATGLPAAPLRSLAGGFDRTLLFGRSTHTLAEVEAARAEGVDYVTFGPVFATPSKAAHGPPRGFDELARAVTIGVPVIALGGVDAAGAEALRKEGVAGVAAIRAFQSPDRARELVRAFKGTG